MHYDINEITTAINAQRIGNTPSIVKRLLTDSRSLCFEHGTLFFALRTTRNDGHKYIAELYGKGVRNFVVDREFFDKIENQESDLSSDLWRKILMNNDANFLVVNNTLVALQSLATYHRQHFCIPVIGITGSNGKTMVKEWLYSVLSLDYKVTRSPRSYNSQIGVPLSLCLIEEDTEVAIIEAGISEHNEMRILEKTIKPSIGVFTSLGTAHDENFISTEQKCKEKLLLFQNTDTIVYNNDNETIKECLVDNEYQGKEHIAWSRKDPSVAMFIQSEEILNEQQLLIKYIFKGKENEYIIPFIDRASAECSIAVACVALCLGVSSERLRETMKVLEPVAMRLEVKQGQNNCILINDCYNSDINSIDIALDFMNRRNNGLHQQHTLILSDISQSGISPKQLYSAVSNMALKRKTDRIIGIGDSIQSCKDVIKIKDKHFFSSVNDFILSPIFKQFHDETILIKGSRDFGFEHITELLEEKVHQTTLEVNLNALVNNFNFYRQKLSYDTKIVCMVKADAYGAGAVEISKTLQEHHTDYLAVALADEGVILRDNGITTPIMVMNPEASAFKAIFDHNLEPEIYSFSLLSSIIKEAKREGISRWPIHIKVDTGMKRLGFEVKDMQKLVDILKNQSAVMPKSVFSHLVGADDCTLDNFSKKQFQLFFRAVHTLQSAFSHHILAHIDNSFGILRFPNYHLDMCRLGIGLYVSMENEKEKTLNVSTLKTTILQKRSVKKGESVGYGRRTIMEKDSIIAVIPIGYADGLNRNLGNLNGSCIVNGKKAPYVGNICMDISMIDVTGIECKEGDKVEIFGDKMSVNDIAFLSHTIPYEVLTSVNHRVKRVYFQD